MHTDSADVIRTLQVSLSELIDIQFFEKEGAVNVFVAGGRALVDEMLRTIVSLV